MTKHEYRERRKEQRIEKLFNDVNLAIMVKNGEDSYDEGTPEEQQARAEAAIMEGKLFVARMFDEDGCDHEELINELQRDKRIVGDVSLFDFSEYAQIMARLYERQAGTYRERADVNKAQSEFDRTQSEFEYAKAMLDVAKDKKESGEKKFKDLKAERIAERVRLGIESGADGAGDGAGADGAGDGAGADGAGDGAGADGAGDGAGADGAGDGAGADGAGEEGQG